MTTPQESPDMPQVGTGFDRREMTAAERDLQEVLAAARALGLETKPNSSDDEFDATAAEALADLGLDRPVEETPTPIPSFLSGDEPAEDESASAVSLEGIQEPGSAWYAINTYTGYEDRVQDSLDKRIRNMDLTDEFVELTSEQAGPPKKNGPERRYVLVPTQKEMEMRGGKRREVMRKLLPGYVLVQIRVDDETGEPSNESWHVVKDTQGVTGFIGSRMDIRERPIPLPIAQVARIIGQTQVAEPRLRVGFKVNDSVRLTDGPFVDMVAEVEEINEEKGKVRVRISMFGRETPLELDFEQVEKQ